MKKKKNPKMSKKDFINKQPILKKGGFWLGSECLLYCNEEPWIKKGVRLLVKKVKPRNVLEIGFGLGFTATQFQECGIKRHVIVEPNKYIYRKALAWRKKYPKKDIEIHNLFSWEFKTRERFDLVYDDRCDLIKLAPPTIKELQKFCKKNTYIATMPSFGKLKMIGEPIYFKESNRIFAQSCIHFDSNKEHIEDFYHMG
jgi:hypothetical protein